MSLVGRNSYMFNGRRVTLLDLLDAGLLAPGDELEYKRPRLGETYRATVTEYGTLVLEDGQEFSSPSKAAMVAADATAIAGWHAWHRPDGTLLDSLRQRLLDQTAAEVATVAPEESADTPWDPQKRYEWLKDARALVNEGKSVEIQVRDLISRWEVGAGYERIEADLANHGLASLPNFRLVGQETRIRLVTPTGDANDESMFSSPDDESQPDIGLTVGNLPAALNGVVSVSPTATLEEAITTMVLNGYSQLAVLQGKHTLRGAVTWQSIAYARHANPSATLADAIIPAREARYDQELIEVLRDLEAWDFVFVRDDQKAVAGIVTTADLVGTYRELSTPFMLIGELDQVLRKLISRKFALDEVRRLCDPDGKRAIDSFDKLEMGDYQRTLENPGNWKKLGWPFDRGTFIKRLDELRLIRNNVMHFNPEPRDPRTVEKLRYMLKLLRDFGSR